MVEPTQEMLTYSERLEKLIDEIGISQAEIAKNSGVDKGTLSRHKRAESEAKISDVIKLAKYFRVSTDYLLGLSCFKSAGQDIQIACVTTGLSEDAIRRICILGEKGKNIINSLLVSKDFMEALEEQ